MPSHRRGSLHHGPVAAAGVVLGAGLGGFLDGILLHQILQWHNMLSSRHPPVDLVAMKVNMLWDGLFHAAVWIATAVGVALLWRAGKRDDVAWSGTTLVGAMAGGWGLFNAVEGVIDHQLLGLHHVRPGEHTLAWDLGFLASGLALIAIGALLVRRGVRGYAAIGSVQPE
jgi:uncharacterized membrane protein